MYTVDEIFGGGLLKFSPILGKCAMKTSQAVIGLLWPLGEGFRVLVVNRLGFSGFGSCYGFGVQDFSFIPLRLRGSGGLCSGSEDSELWVFMV